MNKFTVEIVQNSFKGCGYVFEDGVEYDVDTEFESGVEFNDQY